MKLDGFADPIRKEAGGGGAPGQGGDQDLSINDRTETTTRPPAFVSTLLSIYYLSRNKCSCIVSVLIACPASVSNSRTKQPFLWRMAQIITTTSTTKGPSLVLGAVRTALQLQRSREGLLI